MREIRYVGRFKRDYKREKTGQHGKTLDAALMDVVRLLAADEILPRRQVPKGRFCTFYLLSNRYLICKLFRRAPQPPRPPSQPTPSHQHLLSHQVVISLVPGSLSLPFLRPRRLCHPLRTVGNSGEPCRKTARPWRGDHFRGLRHSMRRPGR